MKKRPLKQISARLFGIIAVAALASILTSVTTNRLVEKTVYNMRADHLLDVVDTAKSALADLDARVQRNELSLEEAQVMGRAALNAVRFDEDSNYVFAFDDNMVLVAHGRDPESFGEDRSDLTDPNGIKIYQELMRSARSGGEMVSYSTRKKGDEETLLPKVSVASTFAPWGWHVGAGTYVEDLDAMIAEINRTIIAILGVTILVLIVVSSLIARSIIKPTRALNARMSDLSDGDTLAEVPGVSRGDEIGDMARAVDRFRIELERGKEMERVAEEARRQSERVEREAAEEKRVRELEEERRKQASVAAAAEEREKMMRELGEAFGRVVQAAIDGEFSSRVDSNFSDEVLNDLARNINSLLDAVDEGLSVTGRVLEKVADGDLTQRMEGDFRGAFAVLQGNTNSMIESLKSLIGEITASGGTLASSSSELRDTAETLAKQAEQNAASLEETSAALEELSASIKQVSSNVSNASSNARSARETAESSGKIAADAAGAMSRISEASKEIAQVVSVINDIAFQINLLALNAGVEAARAGDAGRGFSVVASEVRQLAQRASEAAKEINAVIHRSDEAVSEGVSKVADAQTSLATIADSVVSISAGVDDISTAISEQVMGIGEITTAVGQIDQNTQKQAAAFEEVTAASAVLASEADVLQQSTQRFHAGTDATIVPMVKAPAAAAPRMAPAKVPAGHGNTAAKLDSWDEF
ncbi:methyl-accepting chemotaxis protein [Sulfitobacter sp. LCG007]